MIVMGVGDDKIFFCIISPTLKYSQLAACLACCAREKMLQLPKFLYQINTQMCFLSDRV